MSAKAKAKIKKEAFMGDEAFSELVGGLQQVLAIERGEKKDGYQETIREVPPPPKPRTRKDIAEVRNNLGHSQRVFAHLLNVSTKTVQAWEQGAREPSDAALKLLAVAEKYPDVLYDVE